MRVANLLACFVCGKAPRHNQDMGVFRSFAGVDKYYCYTEPCIQRSALLRKITTSPNRQYLWDQ